MNNYIFNDAYFLVKEFNKENVDNIDISSLKVNFLLFLHEAYYMSKYDVDRLYDYDFLNFDAGPVCTELLQTNLEKMQNISKDRAETLSAIYNKFKDYDEEELINLLKSNPFVTDKLEKYEVIPKSYMKKWFSIYWLERM